MKSIQDWLDRTVFGPALRPFEAWIGARWARAAALAWLIGVGWASWKIAGSRSVESPWPWVVASTGLVLIALTSRYRARPKPAVLVALFMPLGDATEASVDAMANDVLDQVRTQLSSAARTSPRLGSIRVDLAEFRVNVGRDSDRRRLCDRAADEGYAVAVAANVKELHGALTIRWAVLPAAAADSRIRVPDSLHAQIELDQAQVVLRNYKQMRASEIGSLALVVTGIVLLRRRRWDEAEAVLNGVTPATYESLLYAALAAVRGKRFSRALDLARRAVSLEQRPAAMNVVAYAFLMLGNTDLAIAVHGELSSNMTLDDIAPIDPGDEGVTALSLVAWSRGALNSLDEIIATVPRMQAAEHQAFKNWAVLVWQSRAGEASRNDDFTTARDILMEHEDWLGDSPGAAAILAESLAGIGDRDARQWAWQAETYMPDPPTRPSDWAPVVHAYLRMGDPAAAARCLRRVLPYLDHRDREFWRYRLGRIAETPEVDKAFSDVPEPPDPDRLPGKAQELAILASGAVRVGDTRPAAEYALRAEKSLALPDTDAESWASLIWVYLALKDDEGVVRCLERVSAFPNFLEAMASPDVIYSAELEALRTRNPVAARLMAPLLAKQAELDVSSAQALPVGQQRTDRLDAARRLASRAADSLPNPPEAIVSWTSIGIAFTELEMVEEAIRAIESLMPTLFAADLPITMRKDLIAALRRLALRSDEAKQLLHHLWMTCPGGWTSVAS